VEFLEDDARMNIEIVNLTEQDLIDAREWSPHPFSSKYCIYWEYPEDCVDPATEQKEAMFTTIDLSENG